MAWTSLSTFPHNALDWAAVLVATVFIVSSLDDLIIDTWYWMLRLRRRRAGDSRYSPLTASRLREPAEQPLAVLVPAWRDADTIGPVIDAMVNVLEYGNYVI